MNKSNITNIESENKFFNKLMIEVEHPSDDILISTTKSYLYQNKFNENTKKLIIYIPGVMGLAYSSNFESMVSFLKKNYMNGEPFDILFLDVMGWNMSQLTTDETVEYLSFMYHQISHFTEAHKYYFAAKALFFDNADFENKHVYKRTEAILNIIQEYRGEYEKIGILGKSFGAYIAQVLIRTPLIKLIKKIHLTIPAFQKFEMSNKFKKEISETDFLINISKEDCVEFLFPFVYENINIIECYSNEFLNLMKYANNLKITVENINHSNSGEFFSLNDNDSITFWSNF